MKAERADEQILRQLAEKRGVSWVAQRLTGLVAELENKLYEEKSFNERDSNEQY